MSDDIQPYEQGGNDRFIYSNFDRFRYTIPPYIWQELIGISPQKRRSFLLQQRYLTALGFDYAVLEVFKKTAFWILLINFIRFLWDVFLYEYKIITILVIGSFIALFIAFRIQQRSNSRTIRAEITFQFISDGIATAFGLIVTYSSLIHTYITF